MKTRILFPLFLSLSLSQLSANELAWVDEQVNAIKPSREGVTIQSVSQLSSPFVFLEKNKPEKKEGDKKNSTASLAGKIVTSNSNSIETPIQAVSKSLELNAILNKSVLISGNWYRLNETVQGYIVKTIEPKFVVLTKNGKELVLTTKSKNLNLKFNNK